MPKMTDVELTEFIKDFEATTGNMPTMMDIYEKGYQGGYADVMNKLAENALPQPAADDVQADQRDEMSRLIDPINFRHGLAEPGKTQCGLTNLIRLEIADGSRITCPGCLAVIAAASEQPAAQTHEVVQ